MQQTPENRLRLYGVLFLILAAVDVVQIVGMFLSGSSTMAAMMAAAGGDANIVNLSLKVLAVIFSIVVLLKVFLGVRGIQQSQGKSVGTAHIKLAWVAMVIVGIGFISNVVSLVRGQVDWVACCNALASVLILVYYIKEAKAIGTKA